MYDFKSTNLIIQELLSALNKISYNKLFIYTSSIAVYGSVKSKQHVNEKFRVNPESFYGNSKYLAEKQIEYFSKISKFNSVVLRLSSVYGPGLKRQIIYEIIKNSIHSNLLRFNGSIKDKRQFLFVDDCAQMLNKLIYKKHKKLDKCFKYGVIQNYYDNDNFDISREILEKFSSDDEIYFWYKIKKIAQIISEEENDDKSLKYIEDNISYLKQKSPKILFDLANIYKNFENYKIAIDYYTQVLNQIDKNSNMYADVLYRRGGTYERLKNYSKADKDLLMSLKIRPDHAYTLNYLSYSWLERNIKIEQAMKMLMRAYELRENDPYITDSVGWGYYLIGDFINAEKYLRKAVELMPDDPIVNDHYGDVLWQLDRKLQAKYFWEHVLELEDTEEEMKKDIENKLIDGPRKI